MNKHITKKAAKQLAETKPKQVPNPFYKRKSIYTEKYDPKAMCKIPKPNFHTNNKDTPFKTWKPLWEGEVGWLVSNGTGIDLSVSDELAAIGLSYTLNLHKCKLSFA